MKPKVKKTLSREGRKIYEFSRYKVKRKRVCPKCSKPTRNGEDLIKTSKKTYHKPCFEAMLIG